MRVIALALAFTLATPALAGEKPKLEALVLEARTHADGQWWGENAFHFRVAGLKATNLDGQTLTWTLLVKRKLGGWKSARSWAVGTRKVTGDLVADVSFALLYRSLAKAKIKPGEHVAAMVATTADGTEVFRREVAFNLPATGRHAYDPRDFTKPR